LDTIQLTYDFLTLVNRKFKRISQSILLIFSLGLLFFMPSLCFSQNKIETIVIDAGHGGKDPGASGKYSREKDVVLAIALKTGKLLEKKYPNMKVIYTRKTDVFIPLKERAEIANRNNADLFISIHCNSNKSSQPHGTETYVMGLHKSEANLNVAKKENAAILFEDDYQLQYEGFDPNSDESHIIFNFFQNSFLSYNLDFASKVEDEFSKNTPLTNRGVKQAGFWVLYKTTMPGALIETGFLSNTKDEKYLNSKTGQQKISEAIVQAIGDYKDIYDANEKDKIAHINTERQETKTPVTANKNIDKNSNSTTKNKNKTRATNKTSNKTPAQEHSQTTVPPNNNIPVFKVQFLSLSANKKLSGAKYKSIPNINAYKYKGMYRYTSGETQNFDEAVRLQAKVRKAGFKDAFIVAFYQGERIDIKKAKEMLKN